MSSIIVAPLSPAEKKRIQTKSIYFIYILAAIFLIFSIGIYFYFHSFLPVLVVGTILTVCMLLVFYQNKSIIQEVKKGEKNILRGSITDKKVLVANLEVPFHVNQETKSIEIKDSQKRKLKKQNFIVYQVLIEGEILNIDKHWFYLLTIGTEIEIHITPMSKIVLGISLITPLDTSIVPQEIDEVFT